MSNLLSLENLTKVLNLMATKFGSRSQALLHSTQIKSYFSEIDYGIFDEYSGATLGRARLGFMKLGQADTEET